MLKEYVLHPAPCVLTTTPPKLTFLLLVWSSSLAWLARKSRVSLTRIEVFLGRGSIEGQPMGAEAEGNVGGNGDGNGSPKAPVGGLLVQNGTFAWPPTVGFL